MSLLPWLNDLLIQVTPSPSPNPISPSTSSVDIELLKHQLEFLTDANTRLAKSFDFFSKTILAIVALLGGIGVFLFGKTLKEAKQIADDVARAEIRRVVSQSITEEVNRVLPGLKDEIKQEINNNISATITQRIEDVQRAIEREGIIGFTSIEYVALNSPSQPKEVNLLRNRSFQAVNFRSNWEQLGNQYDVLVLDFFTQDFSDEQRLEIIRENINKFSSQSALVIYAPPPPKGLKPEVFTVLDENQVYYTPANNPVALIGRVVDAAHMAYALHHSNNT